MAGPNSRLRRLYECVEPLRVELPDLVTVPRFGRALAAALLLEYACCNEPDPSRVPEIPAWLADGLAQIVFARGMPEQSLSRCLPRYCTECHKVS